MSPLQKREILIAASFGLVSAIISFLIAEWYYSRFIRVAPQDLDTRVQFVRYADSFDLLVELIPEARVKVGPVEFNINRWGCRDDDFELQKSHGVFRVALLGDSVSFPFGLRHEDGWEYQVEQRLRAVQPAEILNFSVSGYNCAQHIIVLREKVKVFEPDLVLLHLSPNDHMATGASSMLPWIDHPGSGYAWVPGNLLRDSVRGAYHRWVFPRRTSEEPCRKLIDMLAESGRGMVLSTPRNGKEASAFLARMKAYAEEMKLPFIDFYPEFAAQGAAERNALFYSEKDDIHLSAEGHRMVMEKMLPNLSGVRDSPLAAR